MKIFNNFDTKLDEKKFLKAKEKYGSENVLLIGKHWFFLFRSIALLFLGFLIFGGLIYFTIKQYESYYTLKIIFITFYSALTGLWIVLTFIKFFGYIKKEGRIVYDMTEESLKSGKFESFMRNSFILLIGQTLVGILNLVSAIVIVEPGISYLWIALQGIFNYIFIWLVYRVQKDYIDFEMDYCLVTPLEIELIQQTGIFNRKSTVIDSDKIKSMTDNKKGLFRSIFNFGVLTVLTEGDEEGKGEIVFKYVPYPTKLKDKIRHIISKEETNDLEKSYSLKQENS